MNNGKVRIYELSRELNLDNKDILAICDQLRIPVKSHSSTISDESAERIRTVAEKYVAGHPSPSKSAPASNKPSSQPISGQKQPIAPKKQQILGIRQQQERSAPHAPKPTGASVAIPPKPPADRASTGNQQIPASMKPSAPARPVRPSQNQEAVAKEKQASPKPELKSEQKSEQKLEQKSEQKREQGQKATVSRPEAEQTKLAEPASKPALGGPNQRQHGQNEQPAKKKPNKPGSGQHPSQRKEQSADKKEPSAVAQKPNRPAAPPIPELHRPKPVVKLNTPGGRNGGAGDEGDSKEDLAEPEILGTTPLTAQDLKRPPRCTTPHAPFPIYTKIVYV